MRAIEVVILAAGLGSRLGSQGPKSMNLLPDGRTIMEQQVDNVRRTLGDRARITVVVGFKFQLLMEHVSDLKFVYNDRFDVTNTNRSLLRALESSLDVPCLWMNGDVVFDARILDRLAAALDQGRSAISVNTARVADEEVKYTVDAAGCVVELSKSVPLAAAMGEAVGVNAVTAGDKPILMRRLAECQDQDYFERGLELAIHEDGLRLYPIDISDLYAVEVDTAEDLVTARLVHSTARQDAALAGVAGDGSARRLRVESATSGS